MKKYCSRGKSDYVCPQMEVLELATESVIAGSPTLLVITMTGQDLRDPISLTSSEYSSIFDE